MRLEYEKGNIGKYSKGFLKDAVLFDCLSGTKSL